MLKTPHERKSALLTSLVVVFLLICISLLKLSYFDPPISYSMEVNFGSSSVGKGEKVSSTKQPRVEKVEQEQPEPTEPTKTSPPPLPKETKVVTQKEPSVVSKIKPIEKKVEEKPTVKKKEVKKVAEKPKPKPKPKPTVSKSTKNVLSKLLNNDAPNSDQNQGEGNDDVAGDKGKKEGNPYANSYYGRSGLGGKGTGYGLSGRVLKSNGSVVQKCNEEGVVVVRITVNRDGKVIDAEPGVKGSTNVAKCLLEPAKRTALLYKWQPDYDAPLRQVGFVVINFKLGE